jgi:actin-related protein
VIGIESIGIREAAKFTDISEEVNSYTPYNSVLSGAGSLTNGIDNVFNEGVERKYRVICPPERGFSSWIGGSILASLTSYEKYPVYKAQYEESGDRIWYRRPFSYG